MTVVLVSTPIFLQSQLPERATAETSTRVQADSVENCNYFETAGGGRARLSMAQSDVLLSILQHVMSTRGEYETSRTSEMHDHHSTNGGGRGNLRAAHSDVPVCILQHTSTDHKSAYITRNAAGHTETDTSLIRPDVRAELGARILPIGNDTTNSRSSQDTLQTTSWKVVCRRHSHRSWTGLGPRGHEREKWDSRPLESRRSAWEARPGGVAIIPGLGVELEKGPLTSAQEKALYET